MMLMLLLGCTVVVAAEFPVLKYPNPQDLNPAQTKHFEMITQAFENLDIQTALLNVAMEEYKVSTNKWKDFVAAIAELEEDPHDKKKLQKWLYADSFNGTAVDLFPNYEERANAFSFKVRLFRSFGDDGYKFKEGTIKTKFQIRKQTVKRGFAGVISDNAFAFIWGSHTASENRKEYEENLHAALASGVVLNAWIGENFKDFMGAQGIEVKAVDPKSLEAESPLCLEDASQEM